MSGKNRSLPSTGSAHSVVAEGLLGESTLREHLSTPQVQPRQDTGTLINIGCLVGAVGIENTTDRNLKDLEGMRGRAKALKRNSRECKGILIGPLKASPFFGPEIPS